MLTTCNGFWLDILPCLILSVLLISSVDRRYCELCDSDFCQYKNLDSMQRVYEKLLKQIDKQPISIMKLRASIGHFEIYWRNLQKFSKRKL